MIHLFSEIPLPGLNLIGGKAQSLARMTQEGLPVPPGFVCSIRFFKPWLTSLQGTADWNSLLSALNGEDDLTARTEALKTACVSLPLNPDQEHSLNEALLSFPHDGLFAVRSSSPEEDLANASFAGGYETYLGVTQETMLDALRAAFASMFDERVFVYKKHHGFSVENPKIAVVVQQLVIADCAGVGFSLNPINNDYDEAVINANFGLSESVVSGMVSPDQFVVNKISSRIVDRKLGGKEKIVCLNKEGGVEERPNLKSSQFCISDQQVQAVTNLLGQIESLYKMPMDIEWAIKGDTIYLLQARPITTHIPLPPEMMTKPNEKRRLYFDFGLVDTMTINQPMTPLTIDWMFGSLGMWLTPFIGKLNLRGSGKPSESVVFGAGGRTYINFSQLLAVINISRFVDAEGSTSQMDALTAQLLANIDVERYKAKEKIPALRWSTILAFLPRALAALIPFLCRTLDAVLRPDQFYQQYKKDTQATVHKLQTASYDHLSLREMITELDNELTPVIGKTSAPPGSAYMYFMMKYMNSIHKLLGEGSEENQRLIESLTTGFSGNDAANIGIQLYRMATMLPREDFNDLDQLAQRISQREMPQSFLVSWDAFMNEFGFRGPNELELSNHRYGDDPRLALEQMSYMVQAESDPKAKQDQLAAARQQAYEKILQRLSGRQRRRLERIYKILDLYGPARDTPKYLWVLNNGAVRRRALQEGQKFVDQGRLDLSEDIFWFTLDEIDKGNADPSFDLRQLIDGKRPYYDQLKQVASFPHLIDSRGRIGQVKMPEGDPSLKIGLGISRGTAVGRVKVLRTPREKPIEKGDVLVTYTTDPGWTPLFVNAEAIILEIGGVLQHGGVVAREYGKPCVVGIQGITKQLQDGQLIEVDGATGVVRLLDS